MKLNKRQIKELGIFVLLLPFYFTDTRMYILDIQNRRMRCNVFRILKEIQIK